MDPEFVELSKEITRNVTAAVTRDVTAAVTAAVNRHVTEVVTAAEERLAKQAEINVEAVKEVAKLAAEGYAASLDSIHRRLDRIESAVKLTLRD